MKKLESKIFIKGTMEAITGLHIGGTNNELSIGGMDNAVIKNPITNKPYLPGSSLKGKMRSLLEVRDATFGDKRMGRDITTPPSNNPNYLASRLFGYTQYNPEKEDEKDSQQPSRVIVRDSFLANEELLGSHLVEVKAETVIDRITSAAMPRQMERVPAGAIFKFDIIINVLTGDDEQEFVHGILDGLDLIMDDYLGGAGSRGSGQVNFFVEEITQKTNEYYTSPEKNKPDDIKEKYKNYRPHLFESKS